MKTKRIIMFIVIFCISLTGCNHNIKETNVKDTKNNRNTISQEITDKNVNADYKNINSRNEATDNIDENSDKKVNDNKKLEKILYDEGCSIKKGECISGKKWLKSKQYNCLRIMIDYIIQPEDKYQHKADYFLFYDSSKKVIKEILYVDYKDKELGSANDFNSFFRDVTFDGNEDLIISIGYFRQPYYCTYIYNKKGFKYVPSFSFIPSPKIIYKNKTIEGWERDYWEYYLKSIFKYKHGKFVTTKTLHYKWDDKMRGYKPIMNTKHMNQH